MKGISAYTDVANSIAYSKTPVGLIVMLYENCSKQCSKAGMAARTGMLVDKILHAKKAEDILVEGLMNSLDAKTDIGKRLLDTYMSWLAEITFANANDDAALFEQVSKEIDIVKTAWEQIDSAISST